MQYNYHLSKSAPVLTDSKPRRRRLSRLFTGFRRKKRQSSKSQIRPERPKPKDDERFVFVPPTKLYLRIYNLDQVENLTYNQERGFLPEEVKWEVICRMRPEWKAEDKIWALGTDGTEYVCSCDLIGQNPIFHLLKSFMRRETLDKHITLNYETYYFEDLLKNLPPEKEDKWYLIQDPNTGTVLEVL